MQTVSDNRCRLCGNSIGNAMDKSIYTSIDNIPSNCNNIPSGIAIINGEIWAKIPNVFLAL